MCPQILPSNLRLVTPTQTPFDAPESPQALDNLSDTGGSAVPRPPGPLPLIARISQPPARLPVVPDDTERHSSPAPSLYSDDGSTSPEQEVVLTELADPTVPRPLTPISEMLLRCARSEDAANQPSPEYKHINNLMEISNSPYVGMFDGPLAEIPDPQRPKKRQKLDPSVASTGYDNTSPRLRGGLPNLRDHPLPLDTLLPPIHDVYLPKELIPDFVLPFDPMQSYAPPHPDEITWDGGDTAVDPSAALGAGQEIHSDTCEPGNQKSTGVKQPADVPDDFLLNDGE